MRAMHAINTLIEHSYNKIKFSHQCGSYCGLCKHFREFDKHNRKNFGNLTMQFCYILEHNQLSVCGPQVQLQKHIPMKI